MKCSLLSMVLLAAALATTLLSAEEKPPFQASADPVPGTTSQVLPSAVPTFHCCSIYWSPEKGEAGKAVRIKFREVGQKTWRDGLPMRYNPVKAPDCEADYRGSIVNLKPATAYEIALNLEGTDLRTSLKVSTWSEHFPVASTVTCASSASTLNVTKSGTPDGYVLYDGTNAVIDTGNKSDLGISVDAKYVILRGFTIRNVKQHGIRLHKGKTSHVVIENCDISKWGSTDEKGFGADTHGGIWSNSRDLCGVVIQRCKIHHPSWDSNSWAEDHNGSKHPGGPQTIVFWESEGNHVIRYNELWSDEEHYYNDVIGGGENASFRGFPGADSDIYGNYFANCWDDGIEAEGGGQNVRIWNNYIENVMLPIGNAAVSIGPLYVWRNVSGRAYTPPGSEWDMTHGPFMKMGFANGEQWMTGHMYVFNNTIFQPNGEGADGLGGSGRVIKHCVTRNNILQARANDRHSISGESKSSVDNDFDWDLLSGRFPPDQEKHGLKGVPQYVAGAGFSAENKTGNFLLAPGSPGSHAGEVIPNFCDVFTGNLPDMGAQQAGTEPMQYGVKAEFVPPGRPEASTDHTGASKVPTTPAPPPAEVLPDIPEQVLAPWREKLSVAVSAALKSGRKPRARLHILGEVKEVRVLQGDAKVVEVEMNGMRLPGLAWEQLPPADGLELARSVLTEGDAAGHVLVAVFARAAKRMDLADEHFSLASKDPAGRALAEAVRESLKEAK